MEIACLRQYAYVCVCVIIQFKSIIHSIAFAVSSLSRPARSPSSRQPRTLLKLSLVDDPDDDDDDSNPYTHIVQYIYVYVICI